MGTDSVTFGPGIFYINDEPIGTGVLIDEVDTIDIPDYYDHPFALVNSIECTLTAEIDVPVFKELIDDLSNPQPFYMEYDGVYYEQVRKHKKKRINKKWAKRYGYREVPCRYRLENAYVRQEMFNDFSIIADAPRIIVRY